MNISVSLQYMFEKGLQWTLFLGSTEGSRPKEAKRRRRRERRIVHWLLRLLPQKPLLTIIGQSKSHGLT